MKISSFASYSVFHVLKSKFSIGFLNPSHLIKSTIFQSSIIQLSEILSNLYTCSSLRIFFHRQDPRPVTLPLATPVNTAREDSETAIVKAEKSTRCVCYCSMLLMLSLSS